MAEILLQKYGLYYFKLDDFLNRYMHAGARKGYPICRKTAGMDAEQIWMREPLLQCREEFDFYREIFKFVAADLCIYCTDRKKMMQECKNLIVEGNFKWIFSCNCEGTEQLQLTINRRGCRGAV